MRPRRPWFRASTQTWMTVIDGKRIPLAKGKSNREEAEQAYYRLMVDRGQIPAKPSDLTVAALCDLFLDHSERHCAPDTYRWHKTYLQTFCELHGRLACRDVKPFHLTRWLDGHKQWDGARRSAQAVVKRAFSWGKEQGLINEHPLSHVKNPPVKRRERIVTAEERDQILAAIKDKAFLRFVKALFVTGARPGEVAKVTAKDINFELGVWILKEHKTAAKTQKPRIIYLNAEMLELSKELAAANPEGPIFRNKLYRSTVKNGMGFNPMDKLEQLANTFDALYKRFRGAADRVRFQFYVPKGTKLQEGWSVDSLGRLLLNGEIWKVRGRPVYLVEIP